MKRPIFIGMLAAVMCALLIPAAAAQADTYSCAFTGAMGPLEANDPEDNGVESISTDIEQGYEGDGFFLLDSDNGQAPDGTYHFTTEGAPADSLCLVVDTADETTTDTGLYSALLSSTGVYENQLCGTGSAADPGPGYPTTLDLTPVAALGAGEDLTEMDLSMQYYAGSGRLNIVFATNGDELDPETGGGLGAVNLIPTVGNCVTLDVTQFQVSGAFAVGTHSDSNALR